MKYLQQFFHIALFVFQHFCKMKIGINFIKLKLEVKEKQINMKIHLENNLTLYFGINLNLTMDPFKNSTN